MWPGTWARSKTTGLGLRRGKEGCILRAAPPHPLYLMPLGFSGTPSGPLTLPLEILPVSLPCPQQ